MNCLSSIKDNIKVLDMFGTKIELTINNNTIHKTLYGAVISSLIITFTVFYFIYNFIDIVNKTRPYVNKGKVYKQNNSFDFSHFPLMINLYDSSLDLTSITIGQSLKICNNSIQQLKEYFKTNHSYCIDPNIFDRSRFK